MVDELYMKGIELSYRTRKHHVKLLSLQEVLQKYIDLGTFSEDYVWKGAGSGYLVVALVEGVLILRVVGTVRRYP